MTSQRRTLKMACAWFVGWALIGYSLAWAVDAGIISAGAYGDQKFWAVAIVIVSR